VFTRLMIKASIDNVIIRFRGCSPLQRTSIYADDVMLFTKSLLSDLVAVRELLRAFGTASRLCINYRKSLGTLIRGNAQDVQLVSDIL
jgi:hypothetical protein